MGTHERSCCWAWLNIYLIQLLYVVPAQLQLGVDCAAPGRHGLWQPGQQWCGHEAAACMASCRLSAKSSGLVLLCTAVHQCTESALERCPLCCEARRLKWSACKLVPQPVLAVGQILLPVGLYGTLYSASGALCDTLLCATNMLRRSGCGPTGRPARPLPSGPCSSLTQQVPEPLRYKTLPPSL